MFLYVVFIQLDAWYAAHGADGRGNSRWHNLAVPERINKLQPDRTVSLRGFDSFAAAATVHSATPGGFTVSGTFRDPADFAVVVLYDADNAFEHPMVKYLPDFNFSGIVLNFNLLYTDGVQPIDSPKYNWIDWATLDCIRADGTTAQIRLWDNAMLAGAAFPAAAASVNVLTSGAGVQPYDRLTVWYQNLAFDYIVPGPYSAALQFFAVKTGTAHSITVNGRTYTHVESAPLGESSAAVAAALIAAVNTPGDPDVTASAGSVSNAVALAVNPGSAGNFISISASDGNAAVTLFLSTPALVAAQIAAQINGTNWLTANPTYALLAATNGPQINIAAAGYGSVNVTGTAVTWVSGARFAGILPGATILIAGTAYAVASVQSPVQLTLTTAPPAASGVACVAARGGRDGNMIQLYALWKTSTLTLDQAQFQLAGGSSAVTWNCTIDFTALGIDQLRQCWLTFAPSLSAGTFTATEWQAVFSNWQLTDPNAVSALQVAGPGSVRIEEYDGACTWQGNWSVESGSYSRCYASGTSDPAASVTVSYTCQFTHNLYVGTSLYSDRATVGVQLDGDTQTALNCWLNTSSAVVTRRLLRTAVTPGRHTVTIQMQTAGAFYFDFLEAAVLSDVPDALAPRTNISAALDFDTDQTYMLTPARLLWIMDKLGYAGPMNEYLGVFWWNERTLAGGSVSTAQIAFTGTFVSGDLITLTLNGTALAKTVFPADTLATIAWHFAAYINGAFVGAWASASGGVLTIVSGSPAAAYNLAISVVVTSSAGQAAIAQQPQAGQSGTWVVNDSASPPINRGTRDWHADFFAQCASRGREVVTSCSMELVNPPAGYVALFPDAARTPVSTATGFGSLVSNQCAVGSSKMLAYQKAVYRAIAQMQSSAGLTPNVQYGEFLWWYFAGPNGGMAYYDDETMAAAQTALGRPLTVFNTPNDDPSVNGGADALFLRNRLRDYVNALTSDLRSAWPTAICELLWPYDVNYPTPVPTVSPTEGGALNRYVNLPVEWQLQSTSGLDRVKVEALAFGSSMRDLDLAQQAIGLFPAFGWPLAAVRYLVPVFGVATPWQRELALVWAAGIPVANLWAIDHVCLFNLTVPEPGLERRSVVVG
jgi:hypothetical protein